MKIWRDEYRKCDACNRDYRPKRLQTCRCFWGRFFFGAVAQRLPPTPSVLSPSLEVNASCYEPLAHPQPR